LSTGSREMVAPPPFDPALFRFNEGICDPTGRFWVGVMFDPVTGSPSPQRAALHSFTFAGGLRSEHHESQLHNGMAFTEDNKRFFLTDSYEGIIYVIDFDAANGTLGSRNEFARIPTNFGLPDGAAIDAEGYYWCAIHGAGRIRRYAPDGAVDRDILLPVSKPTMCAFAGDDLETMYVTSASEGIEIANEPLAGALLRFRPGVSGIQRSFLRPK
jgi:sugar lactone lactonase YvrE